MSVTHEKTMLKAFDKIITERAMVMARETLEIEVDAMRALQSRLGGDDSVGQAVGLLLACKGRVVVSGIGRAAKPQEVSLGATALTEHFGKRARKGKALASKVKPVSMAAIV